MRLFVALHLDPGIRDQLAALVAAGQSLDGGDAVRWVGPESIHLTLAFLGEVEAGRRAGLEAALSQALQSHTAPRMFLDGLGAFPNRRRPRVIWAGLQETGGSSLLPLQASVAAALEPLGWEPEHRPFQPHLTLGRVRDAAGGRLDPRLAAWLEAGKTPPSPERILDRVALVRSHLGPKGSRYEDLTSWRLATGSQGAT
jgi:2'-5' RNA ligase